MKDIMYLNRLDVDTFHLNQESCKKESSLPNENSSYSPVNVTVQKTQDTLDITMLFLYPNMNNYQVICTVDVNTFTTVLLQTIEYEIQNLVLCYWLEYWNNI